MNKPVRQYVTIKTVVAANAKMMGQVPPPPSLTRLGPANPPLPPRPSRDVIAQISSRALETLKAS